jgi:Dolichyl-phosphate-mannose-protein mannosyltransferase
MACNVFLRLGTSSINDFEEARYGVTAFEAQQHRAFVVTTYAGHKELWALKPPFGYWLMALSFSLLGGSALALRLPSALCALAAVAVTMRWAGRWFNPRLAIVSGLILATTFGFLSHHGARSGDFDACLTFLLALVAVLLPGLGESPWRVLALAALLACAFLLKSFAIVPMLLVGGAYALWTGAWRRQRLVPVLAALGLFAAIVGAWAFARWRADGSPDFLLRMLREDVVDRSTSIVDKSTSSPYAYVLALFDRFAPWPLWMLAAAAVAVGAGRLDRLRLDRWTGRLDRWAGRARAGIERLRRDRILSLLALWTTVPLAFVSLVRTQHHWYLDPIYPALAMLAAGSALFLVERSPGRRRGLAFAALVALPLVLCEGRVLGRVLLEDRMPADQLFLGALSPSTDGCREIRSTFKLAYSERFLLEVVDGFQVVEPAAGRPPAARSPSAAGALPAAARPLSAATGPLPAATGPLPAATDPLSSSVGPLPAATCLLIGKSPWRRPPAPSANPLPAHGPLLAGNASFALYRGAAGSGGSSGTGGGDGSSDGSSGDGAGARAAPPPAAR